MIVCLWSGAAAKLCNVFLHQRPSSKDWETWRLCRLDLKDVSPALKDVLLEERQHWFPGRPVVSNWRHHLPSPPSTTTRLLYPPPSSPSPPFSWWLPPPLPPPPPFSAAAAGFWCEWPGSNHWIRSFTFMVVNHQPLDYILYIHSSKSLLFSQASSVTDLGSNHWITSFIFIVVNLHNILQVSGVSDLLQTIGLHPSYSRFLIMTYFFRLLLEMTLLTYWIL